MGEELLLKQSYYIFNNGELKRKDNTLEFYLEDGGRKTIPIEQVRDLYFFGQINVNSALMNFLASCHIAVHWFNYYGYYSGTFYPREYLVSGKLLVKQVEHYINPEKRIVLAKAFVDGASANIYRNLRYYKNRGKDLSNIIDEIDYYRNQINVSDNIESLMGIEGNIRKVYYTSWNEIINQDVEFEKRVKRPPDNMINTLISFLNSMLYTKTLSEIYNTQLNPTISYLHEPGTGRFSLSLDISEIFKPLIVDRLIFSLLNKNQINEDSFYKETELLQLKESAIKTIVAELDIRLKQTIEHRELKRSVSYLRLIRLEVYKLIKHLLEEKVYEPFKIWW